jgi:hypothetical protein
VVIDLLIERVAKLENGAILRCAAHSPNEDVERIPVMDHLLGLRFGVNGTDDVLGFIAVGAPLHIVIEACMLE